MSCDIGFVELHDLNNKVLIELQAVSHECLLNFNLESDFDWQNLSLLALEVETSDMVGQQLDTNPATIVDWQNGAWSNYEDTLGSTQSDVGGTDMSMRLIDDGSDLYAPVVVPPPGIPQPDAPSSGGGSLCCLLLGLMLRGLLGAVFTKQAVKHKKSEPTLAC